MKLKKILIQFAIIWVTARGKGIDFDSRPQKPKGFWGRLADMLYWYIKHGQVQQYYYVFGFDYKDRKEQNKYFSTRDFLKLINKNNAILVRGSRKLDYTVLTIDKYVANVFLQGIGIPVAKSEALIINNRVLWTKDGESRLDSLLTAGFESIYVKPLYGYEGLGIMRLELGPEGFYYKGERLALKDLETKLAGNLWAVQQRVKQHEDLNKFNSSATNTLRIITIMNRGEPEFVSAFMRIIVGKSHVDNWGFGSVMIGVNHPEGSLWEQGYYLPKKHTMDTCTVHPESKIPFGDYKIPYYDEAVKYALRAHKFYHTRFILSFDFAIREDGPVIIEVNSKPFDQGIQMFHDNPRKQLFGAKPLPDN